MLGPRWLRIGEVFGGEEQIFFTNIVVLSLFRDVSSFKPNPPQEKRLVTKGEGVLLVNQESSERPREENCEGEELEEGGRKRSQDGVKKLSPSETVTVTFLRRSYFHMITNGR